MRPTLNGSNISKQVEGGRIELLDDHIRWSTTVLD